MADLGAEEGEGAGVQSQGDLDTGASLEPDFVETLEFLGRTRNGRGVVADMELDHCSAVAGAGIGDRDADGDRAISLKIAIVMARSLRTKLV